MTADSRFPALDLPSAAALLGLAPGAVRALVERGYLAASTGPDGSFSFGSTDLKAFVARNADNGSGSGLLDRVLAQPGPESQGTLANGTTMPDLDEPADMEPEELLDLLDERAEAMARRVLVMVVTIYPEAATWSDEQKARFVQRTKSRFESVLAVAALGTQIEDSVYDDLKRVGAAAARSATDLERLLILLRMSRDLVVQNAVELSGADGRHGSYALSLLLTRILPAMDRISDALSSGYWEALFAS